jgi:hypothetical protein
VRDLILLVIKTSFDCNLPRIGNNDVLLLLLCHISVVGQFIVAPKLTTCTLKIKYVIFVGNGTSLLAINSYYILKLHSTGYSTHWRRCQYNHIAPDILQVSCNVSITTS